MLLGSISIATPEYSLPYRKEKFKSIGVRYVEDSGLSRQKYSYRLPYVPLVGDL